jgi:hypothetical protein
MLGVNWFDWLVVVGFFAGWIAVGVLIGVFFYILSL